MLAVNYTLTLDLSLSWARNPEITTIAKSSDGVPILYDGSLWTDDRSGTIYSFGGLVPINLTDPGTNLYARDSGGWRTVPQGQGEAAPSPSSIRPAGASSTFGNGVGYMLGGFIIRGEYGQQWPLPGLLSYNMTSNSWLNISSAPISPFGTSLLSRLEFIPNFGSEGVMIAMGGQYSDKQSKPWSSSGDHGGGNFSFSNITIFDIASKNWYWQTATGDIPSPRSLFCSTGAESNEGTYEVFVYGGNTNGFYFGDVNATEQTLQAQNALNGVYILSLPGFVWFKANDTSAQPRTMHSCNTVGNRQMASVGGLNPTLYWMSAFNDTKDNFYDGIGIFDMVELQWKSGYDAQAAPYTISRPIREWYNNS